MGPTLLAFRRVAKMHLFCTSLNFGMLFHSVVDKYTLLLIIIIVNMITPPADLGQLTTAEYIIKNFETMTIKPPKLKRSHSN